MRKLVTVALVGLLGIGTSARAETLCELWNESGVVDRGIILGQLVKKLNPWDYEPGCLIFLRHMSEIGHTVDIVCERNHSNAVLMSMIERKAKKLCGKR